MKITHTSPSKITEITSKGAFDDCLFFSSDEYCMAVKGELYIYSLEVSEEKIVSVGDLYDEDLISHIANALDVDEEAAERMLDGRNSAFDYGLDGEDDWWIQAKQGECAKLMGYEAVMTNDEQGTVYIVPMFGREKELKLERVDES